LHRPREFATSSPTESGSGGANTVETLTVPEDLAEALNKADPARTEFDLFSPSSRRAILEWLSNAKTRETRDKRIAEIARLARHGIRANYPADKAKKEKLDIL